MNLVGTVRHRSTVPRFNGIEFPMSDRNEARSRKTSPETGNSYQNIHDSQEASPGPEPIPRKQVGVINPRSSMLDLSRLKNRVAGRAKSDAGKVAAQGTGSTPATGTEPATTSPVPSGPSPTASPQPPQVPDLRPTVGSSAPVIPAAPKMASPIIVPPTPSLLVPPTAMPPASLDPFDPARLRVRCDGGALGGYQKLPTSIQARKPSREWFIRTSPDPDQWIVVKTLLLKHSENSDLYLVDPEIAPYLEEEPTFGKHQLALSMNRAGVLFFWYFGAPDDNGDLDRWNRSAAEAADYAREHWIRFAWNKKLNAHETITSRFQEEPQWTKVPMSKLLKLAFTGKYIDSLNHPVLRQLEIEVE